MSKVNINFDNNTKTYLKETFSDKECTISEVDVNAFNAHIKDNDAQLISDFIHDALIDMGIKHDGFNWDINVSVEQFNEKT
jgi:hypothetical protein|tara:strand:+ start:168 stop:410 length:243 start_codon:yes stop_codon:yes gene_type:complete